MIVVAGKGLQDLLFRGKERLRNCREDFISAQGYRGKSRIVDEKGGVVHAFLSRKLFRVGHGMKA